MMVLSREHHECQARSICQMRSSHTASAVTAVFDDANLIGYGGLEPVVRLAEGCGLPDLVGQHLRITGAANSGGANPAAKVMSLVAGMLAGADSIDDIDRLRHGGMGLLFDGTRAPSTAGTFLRSFTHGHNRQLHAVHRAFLAELAAATQLLPGADQTTFVDIDPSHVRVYGRAKQGAEYGRLKGKRTLHPLISTISTPHAAPVVGPVRLRRGKAADVRGAESFCGRGDRRRPPGGGHRHHPGAGGLEVLHRRGGGRLPPRRRVVFRVDRDQPVDHRRDRPDPLTVTGSTSSTPTRSKTPTPGS
jgi:hypothetical protein